MINTLAFNITMACNFKCHCCAQPAESSIDSSIPKSAACRVIDEFYNLQMLKRVHFTGGEPFLEYDILVNLASHANSLGISSGVVTNASWCTSDSIAQGRSEELEKCGVDLIAVSYDAYHSKFIPLGNIVSLIKTAQNIGQEVVVLSVLSDDLESETDALLRELLNQCTVEIRKRWLVPVGRASCEPFEKHALSLKDFEGETCIQNLGTILPNGELFPCCSAGTHQKLSIGNISKFSAAEMLEFRRRNGLLEILKREGPIGVLCRLPSHVRNRLKIEKYSSSCHLCYKIIDDEIAYKYCKNMQAEDIDLAEMILLSSSIRS